MITRDMIAAAVEADEFFLDWLFAEVAGAFGYDAWYECEELWDEICDLLEELGCPTEATEELFSQMAADL